MPKILVLFHSRTGDATSLAEAIAEGARSIRFSEVDVRRTGDPAPPSVPNAAEGIGDDGPAARYRTLGSIDELPAYDALVLEGPSPQSALPPELASLFGQAGPLGRRGAFLNTVGSAFTSTAGGDGSREAALWSIMTPMAGLGMIIVAPYHGGSAPPDREMASGAGLAAAYEHGKRIADVVAWITHARSHAHSHSH